MEVRLNISGAVSKFDWIVRSCVAPTCDMWDVPLIETPSFVAVASLGSIVPGWVLVVPRAVVVNLAALTAGQRNDLALVREKIAATLARAFGNDIFEFEHGPVAAGGLLGCGVEQAHLHIVSLPFDLLEAVAMADEAGEVSAITSEDPWADIDRGRDYWMARNLLSGAGVVAYPHAPISQGIRKIVAAGTGQADAWDYRTHPHLDHVNATIRAFSRAVD